MQPVHDIAAIAADLAVAHEMLGYGNPGMDKGMTGRAAILATPGTCRRFQQQHAVDRKHSGRQGPVMRRWRDGR